MANLLATLALVSAAPLAQAAAQQAESPRPTDTRVRFEQTLTIRTPDNAAQPMKVALRDWVIRNRQKASVTTTGALVIQVRAGGPLTTVINGQRVERKDDEFFAVPAGATLEVETGDDTAVLTVLEIQR